VFSERSLQRSYLIMKKILKGRKIVEKSFIKIKIMVNYPFLRVTDDRNEQITTASVSDSFCLINMIKELINPLN
jgi:hypothetical protein